jgi:hypothetical protein
MRILILLIALASAASAQPIPVPSDADNAIAGTLNLEGSVTAGVTDLVTTVAPSIMTFGWSLLALFGVYALLQTLIQSTMRSLSSYHHNTLAITVAYVAVLFRIACAAAMLSFYMRPLPGVPFNFHQMFPYLANALSSAVSGDLLTQVLTQFNNAIHYLPSAGMFEVLPALLTLVVIFVIALAEVAMTMITAGSYAIVGLLTLCGPLMIPFYVLPGHDKRFWAWFDNMLAYSMYVFIGTGFIFIFCHPYLDFFANLHGYTAGQWLVSVPYLILITVVFLWTMFRVPEITHIVFGGIGGVAQGFFNSIQGIVVRGIVAAAL